MNGLRLPEHYAGFKMDRVEGHCHILLANSQEAADRHFDLAIVVDERTSVTSPILLSFES
jgi:hypothetical protein